MSISPWVAAVAAIALLEYLYFGMQTGTARGRFQVAAPATTGHPVFERYFRAQMNTLEQLIVFLPSLFLFAHFVHAGLAVVLGLVFVLGRALFFRGYVADPARRGRGFLISFAANVLLVVGALLGAVGSAL